MRSALPFVAGVVVGLGLQGGVNQPHRDGVMLNHIAISVPDFDEGIRFYTKALGAKEAITFRDDRGRPFSYLQLSRDTFLEVQPADARLPGFAHIGLEVQNLRKTVPQFRAAGFEVTDPAESARTKALISQATDKNGVHFELLEFGPDSAQRKAMDSWK